MYTQLKQIAAKVEALEKQISTVEVKLTEKLKQETEKTKKSIEEELNTSFQMSLLDKTSEAHNNLEQYTRKNSVRLFGVKETDDVQTTPESQVSTELHWEIFCCITSYNYNSNKMLGHVTSPESKMAERDVSISHYTDFVFLFISTLFCDSDSDDLLSISE